MHALLEVRDQREHREHRSHQHAVLPLPARTQCEVRRIAFRRMEGGITQDNHTPITLRHQPWKGGIREDRKSTRLNSSHVRISYAVFCLKKKNLDHISEWIV